MANEKEIEFAIALTGGVKPWSVSAEIAVGGEVVSTLAEVSGPIRYMPVAFGVHTLTLIATDAEGTVTTASASVPVAVNEREKAADWKKAFPTFRADQTYADKLIAIAASQLGYAESERNFIIAEDGTQRGYTRYGDWLDRDYEEWDAMFVAFCLRFAEIPDNAMPGYETAQKWMEKLKDDYIADVDNYQPEPGDLIFFELDANDGETPDHMGIVTRADEKTIYTIEGNSEKSVRECRYAPSDNTIVGYASLRPVMEKHDSVYQAKQAEAQAVLAAAEQPAEGEDAQEEPAEDGEDAEDDQQPAEDGEAPTEDGEESTEDGEESTEDGEAPTEDGEESTEDGEESTEDGEESTEDGEESAEDGEEAESSDGAAPYTIETLTAEDERWAAIEALMPGELTMLAAYDITGDIDDEAAGVEVTIPGVALEDPLNTFLLHFASLDEGAEPENVEYEYDEENGAVVFTAFGFSPYVLAQRAPVLLGATEPVKRTIQIDVCDMDGNALTYVPGRSVTLYYYEIPIKELEAQPDIGSLDDLKAMFNLYKRYEGRLTIDEAGKHFILTMNADASAENPYLLFFDVNGLPEIDETGSGWRTGGMNYKVSDWIGSFSLEYDGENITRMSGMTEDDDENKVLHGKIYHDSSRVTSSLKLKTDASVYPEDSDYPVYAAITLETEILNQGGNIIGFHTQTVKQLVSADGTVDVTFPDKIGTAAVNGRVPRSFVSVTLYTDEACTQEATTWTYTTPTTGNYYDSSSQVAPGSDGMLHGIDSSNGAVSEEIFTATFEKREPVQKTLEISAYDLSNNPLADADIPAEGVTIYYYMYAQKDMPVPTYNPGSSEEAMLAYMRQQYEFMKARESTLVLSAHSQNYTLDMPVSATSSNQYTFMFRTSPIQEPTAGSSYYTPYGMPTTAAEWTGSFSMRWNGTDVLTQSGITVDDEGVAHGRVYHDTTLTSASLELKFNASDYAALLAEDAENDAYPIYARVTLRNMVMTLQQSGTSAYPYPVGTQTQVEVREIGEDGTITIEFPEKVQNLASLGYTGYPANVRVELFADAACQTPLLRSDWSEISGQYSYAPDGDSVYYEYNAVPGDTGRLRVSNNSSYAAGDPLTPSFRKRAQIRVTVPSGLIDPSGLVTDAELPLWMKATLAASYEDDDGNPVEIEDEKIVALSNITTLSNGTLADPVAVSFDRLVPEEAEINLNAEFYLDEACTEPATEWNPYIAEGEAEITARKQLDGRPLGAEEFTFTIEGYDIQTKQVCGFRGDTELDEDTRPPRPELLEAKNDADGLVCFGKAELNQDDIGRTYCYLIRETIPEEADRAPHVTYTERAWIAKLTVTDKGEGEVGGTLAYSYLLPNGQETAAAEEALFVNTYEAETEFTLPLGKKLVGKDWAEGETYSVLLEGVRKVDLSDLSESEFTPEPITLIFEHEAGSGKDEVVSSGITVPVSQEAIGHRLEYNLTEQVPGTAIAYGADSGDMLLYKGVPLRYSTYLADNLAADKRYQRLRWKLDSVLFDDTVHTVQVTGAYEDGELKISVTVDGEPLNAMESAPVFENIYSPFSAKAEIDVRKTISGREKVRGNASESLWTTRIDTYRFEISADPETPNAPLPAEDKRVIEMDSGRASDTNIVTDDTRKASFTAINYTREDLKNADGTYATNRDFYYTVRELFDAENPEARVERDAEGNVTAYTLNHVTYELGSHRVKVALTENEADGTLSTVVSYYDPESGEWKPRTGTANTDLPFVNEYQDEPLKFAVDVKKLMDSAPAEDGTYAFELYDSANNLVQTLTFSAKDAENGVLHFPIDTEIGMDAQKTGSSYTYRFTLVEQIPAAAAAYLADGTELQLRWGDATAAQRTDNTLHWYLDGITYDPTRIGVNALVTFNRLFYAREVKVSYTTGEPQATFANTTEYHAAGSGHAEARKVIDGRGWLTDETYDFELTALDGAPLRVLAAEGDEKQTPKYELKDKLTATATEAANASFADLYFLDTDLTEGKGTFSYRVREIVPDAATVEADGETLTYADATEEQRAEYDGQWQLKGVTYAAEQIFVFTVTDNGDGTLTVARTTTQRASIRR